MSSSSYPFVFRSASEGSAPGGGGGGPESCGTAASSPCPAAAPPAPVACFIDAGGVGGAENTCVGSSPPAGTGSPGRGGGGGVPDAGVGSVMRILRNVPNECSSGKAAGNVNSMMSMRRLFLCIRRGFLPCSSVTLHQHVLPDGWGSSSCVLLLQQMLVQTSWDTTL